MCICYFQKPVDPEMDAKISSLQKTEEELKQRVKELERRETAYLEMLTQADDMWAEMEGGYKKKIDECKQYENHLKEKVKVFSVKTDTYQSY